LAGDAVCGTTTVAPTPTARAAQAVPRPWLPALAVTARSVPASRLSAASAPRPLNEPVGCGVSSVSRPGTAPRAGPAPTTRPRRRRRPPPPRARPPRKNPLVVLADANLDRAVEHAVQGAFYSTGQRCTASSRLIVEAPVFDRFAELLTQRTKSLVVGHALERSTQIGPVVSRTQLDGNLGWIATARDEGAQWLCGGDALERPTRGHYMSPALFVAQPRHRIAREEVFGPVACLIRADDYDHALALANDTPYGLCAGICTDSLARAAHFRRHAQAGMVMVNLPTAGVDSHVPFGGRKGSSYGPREQGRHAAEFYTTVKTAYTQA